MSDKDYEHYGRRGGAGWFFAPVIIFLLLGAALSVGAFIYADTQLTIAEALAAGYGGLAGIIIGLFAAAVGIVVGLFGALLGIVAAGGAAALTLFIVASPIIAIILFVLLMRRSKSCPNPAMHEAIEE